jgi:hypothetical protein
MFFRIPGHLEQHAVALITKGGSQSIQDCSVPVLMSNQTALGHRNRWMFVREPVDRFQCNYSFYSNLSNLGKSYLGGVPRESLQSYESFVDYALSHEDIHWQPQIELVMSGDVFVPNLIYKFDKINEIWPTFCCLPLNHKNAAPKLAVNDHRINEIKKKYRDDTVLYMGARDWP